MEILPFWFKVLYLFNNKNYFNNGLTIPFLLGASTVLNPEEKIISLEDFLSTAAGDGLPQKISLQKCANIGQYVVGIIDNETINYPYGRSVYNKLGNIYFTDNSLSNVKNIESLLGILLKDSQNFLDSKSYSFNAGCWGDYSEIEKSRILQASES